MALDIDFSGPAQIDIDFAETPAFDVDLLPAHLLGQHTDFDASDTTAGYVLTRLGDGTYAMAVSAAAGTFLSLTDTPGSYAGAGTFSVKVNAGETALELVADPAAGHLLLSATHTDTLAASAVRGDIVVANATPVWAKLAVGGAGTYLQGGTDPAWTALDVTDDVQISGFSGSGTTVVRTVSPTIVTPVIASFATAQHDHEDAAGGATLDHNLATDNPTSGTHGVAGSVVGTTDTQTITGKLLDDFSNDIFADHVHEQLRNESGSAMALGDAVYISGFSVGQQLALVQLADSGAAGTMPSIACLDQTTLANNATGDFVEIGTVTPFDTSMWSVGDDLYVSNVGTSGNTLTNVKPTGTDLIQKVGVVLRSHATLGVIEVFGAGRTNDLPNIPNDDLWIGDGSGVPQAVSLVTGSLAYDGSVFLKQNISKSITIDTPVATDDRIIFWTQVAITVNEVRSIIKGTTNVEFNIHHVADITDVTPQLVFTADITQSNNTTGTSNSSGFSDNTIPANRWVMLNIVSVSGSPSEFHVTIEYTED